MRQGWHKKTFKKSYKFLKKEPKKPTATIIPTIYWLFMLDISKSVHTAVIHPNHSINVHYQYLGSLLIHMTHEAVAIPPDIVILFAAFATHDALWVR